MDWQSPHVTEIIRLALEEDFASADATAAALVQPHECGRAAIIAKEDLVFCGGPLVSRIIEVSSMDAAASSLAREGSRAEKGAELGIIEGKLRAILSLERTILNFLQRLCGVATFTRAFVDAAPGIAVYDTRKTMPGMRALDKYAVTAGGGKNHRMNLRDMILIKNNHIDALGGDFSKLQFLLQSHASPGIPVEVEVRNAGELSAALDHMKPSVIMLDNMSDDEVRTAVSVIRERAGNIPVEISGGITKERARSLAAIDSNLIVSVGALTTQARNVDISMRLSR